MRKIKELLRLHFDQGVSLNQASRACSIARSTAQDYVRRFRSAGLPWPLPLDIDAKDLNDRLFALPPNEERKKPLPDWPRVHRELSRKGVTLKLLWEEYRQATPEGYSYAQFLRGYRTWAGKLDVTMRQRHKAGEKLFVDFAGQTMEVIAPDTGEVRTVQIFVATLGFSNLLFVWALESQGLEAWIDAHNRALRYLGGVPEVVVPDNLKSGVKRPCRYEPELNPTYQEWAEHNGVAVVPARVRKPRDKAKVEVGVQVVERWVLAPLRNRRFFSLAELNEAIGEMQEALNARRMPSLDTSRRELFDSAERQALRPLPPVEYEFGAWKRAKVHMDYHIEVDRHYYSVPYALACKTVEIKVGRRMVEVFHEGARVASHLRSPRPYTHTTCPEHMPKAHQEATGWSAGRFLSWAKTYGPATTSMVKAVMAMRKHPEQGFRSCLGLLRLEQQFGSKRLERACEKALYFGLIGRRPVLEILKKKQDMLENPPDSSMGSLQHANIRGPKEFQ